MTTPMAVLTACVRMLPQLVAEEHIGRANEIAVGTGSIEKEAARKMTRQWSRMAEPRRRRRRPATAASIWGGLADIAGGPKMILVPTKPKQG